MPMPESAANEETMQPDNPGHGQPGVLKDARALWEEVQGLSHDYLRLAALETRRAGESLVGMVIAGVLAAVLLNGAWLGLCAAAVGLLVSQGVSISCAILLAVVFNLSAALACLAVIRRKSRYLSFPATVSSLQVRRQKASKP